MNFHGWILVSALGLVMNGLSACASGSSKTGVAPAATEATAAVEGPGAGPSTEVLSANGQTPKKNSNHLICRASKKRFHYDWNPNTSGGGPLMTDANDIRFEFRSANRPAGKNGENLKIGECGWAEAALANSKKTPRSRVVFKSLSDEATQTFYKMKTGRVFKVPVRATKQGMIAAPGGVSLVR